MGSSKPKPVQAPYQGQTQTTNTYGYMSPYGQQGVQEFLDVPLDFGDEYNVDPGVGRRAALAEQEVENRYGSALNAGVPGFIRQMNQAKELRDVQGQGAYEAQQANYLNQQGNNALRSQRTMAELQRRQTLLPNILQTGGSGSTSGYNTQIVQPQPGFWQRAVLTALGGASTLPRFGF